jgi:predicted small lipoprotein YifL
MAHVRFLLVLTLLLATAGCGQKGPLYLPGETPPARTGAR